MLRVVGGAGFRRKLIGIGPCPPLGVTRGYAGLLPGSHERAPVGYRSRTYRPGAGSIGSNPSSPSCPGRSLSPPLRSASHDE